MLRKASLFGWVIVGVIIGVVGLYAFQQYQAHHKWIVLTTEGAGHGWASEAIER